MSADDEAKIRHVPLQTNSSGRRGIWGPSADLQSIQVTQQRHRITSTDTVHLAASGTRHASADKPQGRRALRPLAANPVLLCTHAASADFTGWPTVDEIVFRSMR
jgi:hypothetical protein